MMKTNKRQTHKLSLSSQTLRRLTMPELGRAQGGLYITISYCVDIDEKTIVRHTIELCATSTRRFITTATV